MLVLGDRGLSRIEGVLVGSTAAAMAAHAVCPIVVVRGAELDDEATRTLPVVVGVDDSPSSEAAIEFAFEAAAAQGVPLVAVHAYAEPIADPMFAKVMDWDVIAREESHRPSAHLAAWIEKYPELTVRQVPARDLPVHQLIGLSEAAQLVVVGSRGRGAIAGLLLGSVSNSLITSPPARSPSSDRTPASAEPGGGPTPRWRIAARPAGRLAGRPGGSGWHARAPGLRVAVLLRIDPDPVGDTPSAGAGACAGADPRPRPPVRSPATGGRTRAPRVFHRRGPDYRQPCAVGTGPKVPVRPVHSAPGGQEQPVLRGGRRARRAAGGWRRGR